MTNAEDNVYKTNLIYHHMSATALASPDTVNMSPPCTPTEPSTPFFDVVAAAPVPETEPDAYGPESPPLPTEAAVIM